MIQEVKMFTIICDRCKKDVCNEHDYSCWNDEGYAEEISLEDGWVKDGDCHYCPDCFTYDENDNLIVKE